MSGIKWLGGIHYFIIYYGEWEVQVDDPKEAACILEQI